MADEKDGFGAPAATEPEIPRPGPIASTFWFAILGLGLGITIIAGYLALLYGGWQPLPAGPLPR